MSRKSVKRGHSACLANVKFRPQIIKIFSYAEKSSPPESAPLVNMTLLETTPPGPWNCKVLSSSKRALSAPLSRYTYSHQDKAYSNQSGYTWTPAYLKYCQPTIAEKFAASDSDADDNVSTSTDGSEDRLSAIRWCKLLSAEMAESEPIVYSLHRTWRKPKSYSKFMESPYLKRPKSCLNQQRLSIFDKGGSMKIRVITTQH